MDWVVRLHHPLPQTNIVRAMAAARLHKPGRAGSIPALTTIRYYAGMAERSGIWLPPRPCGFDSRCPLQQSPESLIGQIALIRPMYGSERTDNAALAQLVELRTRNVQVAGSIPAGGSIFNGVSRRR